MQQAGVESVDSVVAQILASKHGQLPASDLFVLCTRFYNDAMLPTSRREPDPLNSLSTFTAYLRSLQNSRIQIEGESNDCDVKLRPPAAATTPVDAQQSQPAAQRFDADTRQHAGAGSASEEKRSRFEVGDQWSDVQVPAADMASHSLPSASLEAVRRGVCRYILNFVLTEASANSSDTAMTIDNARNRCTAYLVCVSLPTVQLPSHCHGFSRAFLSRSQARRRRIC